MLVAARVAGRARFRQGDGGRGVGEVPAKKVARFLESLRSAAIGAGVPANEHPPE
jgi:hypothetical protein